jgi:hypothetical protein
MVFLKKKKKKIVYTYYETRKKEIYQESDYRESEYIFTDLFQTCERQPSFLRLS